MNILFTIFGYITNYFADVSQETMSHWGFYQVEIEEE